MPQSHVLQLTERVDDFRLVHYSSLLIIKLVKGTYSRLELLYFSFELSKSK